MYDPSGVNWSTPVLSFRELQRFCHGYKCYKVKKSLTFLKDNVVYFLADVKPMDWMNTLIIILKEYPVESFINCLNYQ